MIDFKTGGEIISIDRVVTSNSNYKTQNIDNHLFIKSYDSIELHSNCIKIIVNDNIIYVVEFDKKDICQKVFYETIKIEVRDKKINSILDVS